MENKFIQMAASAGRAVSSSHYQLCAAVFHEYFPLKRQLSLACRRNTPQIIVQRCHISEMAKRH